ncbi:MAG: hypothetical protein ACR2HH_08320 [Chthoniobacterales bacterium]
MAAREKDPPAPTLSPPAAPATAPFEQRLAAAKSVKVMTSVLGIELGAALETAKAILGKLNTGGIPPKEETEGDEGAQKVLWQLVSTDYSAIFVKTDDKMRITDITAFLREGKELPFDKIGEVKKAPILSSVRVAWDVVRPNRPLFRVVAEGADGKARSVSIFLVRRPNLERTAPAVGATKTPVTERAK